MSVGVGRGFRRPHTDLRRQHRVELGRGVGLRDVVQVDLRGADVLVAHVVLHVAQRDRLGGKRAEAVAQIVPDERAAAGALLAQVAES